MKIFIGLLVAIVVVVLLVVLLPIFARMMEHHKAWVSILGTVLCIVTIGLLTTLVAVAYYVTRGM